MTGLTFRAARHQDIPAIRAFMLSIFEQDYGYGYQPQWHWDYDDLRAVYLDHPRHTMILALDGTTGAIIGMAGLRSGGPTLPSLPPWLVERYKPHERAAQIVRVFTHPDHRRRGIAQLLVAKIRRFVRDAGEYDVICLHTENAVDFWQAMGCQIVFDGRAGDPPDGSVHFELAMLESDAPS